MADRGQKDGEVDPETRRGLQILAYSTKTEGSEGAARQLYKAALTGNAEDYQQAEALFDALPTEKRSSIRANAETKAETIRDTHFRRKNMADKPAPAPDEFIEWRLPDPESSEGLFQTRAPAPEARQNPSSQPASWTSRRQEAAQHPSNSGKSWDISSVPGKPVPGRSADNDAEAGRNWDPATQPAQAKRGPNAAAAETGKAGDIQSIPGNRPPARPKAEDNEDGKNWDWRKLPDDPVMRSSQKKKATPKSELDALREEMLRTLKD